MRKILWGLATIITASLIVVACQKEVASPLDAHAPFDAKAAKEWYYGTYKKTAEWAGYDAVTNGKRLPDWEKGIQRKIGKLEIVEFPFVKEKNSFKMIYRGELSAESKRKMAEAALSRLLFTKYPSGAIQVREMQYIPDMDYLARHNFDASSNSFGDIDDDFSGTIVAKIWNGQEVSRKILKNGKITASFKKALSQPASPTESCPIGTIQVDEYARDCESHLYGDGMFTYQCDPWFATGNQWCIGEEEMNENPDCTVPNSPECSCSLTGGCEDPGGGGEEDPDDELINNVENPCIRSMVDQAISRDCNNTITTFMNTTFANNENLHLVFYDSPLGLINGDAANTVCAPMNTPGDFKITITLNNSPGVLNGSSNEYVAITIFHEALHAWIDLYSSTSGNASANHELMASPANLNLMADALREMYPNISQQDALDLAWGGLESTAAWAALSPADKNRINQTNADYLSQTKGTPCTP